MATHLADGRRRYAGLRRSAAVVRTDGAQRNRRSVLVALVANVVVATAKLAVGVLTGSSALLAEAAHSVADSMNELMLGLSWRRARRPADAEHPLGYGGARFLWAFLAAISSFLIGGCLSVGLAINELVHAGEVGHYLAAWIVLGVATVADGASLAQTLRTARREAALWGQPTLPFLRRTGEPTLRALAVEDTAALVGVALAAAGLAVHQIGGPASSDAIASLVIGLLLGVTAICLARPLADLLIGRSMPPDRLQRVRETIAASPALDELLDVVAVHVAPQEVLVAAKVHPAPEQTGELLAARLDELDILLRRDLPEIGEVFIDVTENRRGA